MNDSKDIEQLRSALKQLKDEDLVPALFLMEMDIEQGSFRDFQHELDRNLIHKFIQRINTIKELSEIRSVIFNYYSTQSWRIIHDYLDEISHLVNRLINRGKDLSNYKSNPRLLAFALNYYIEDSRNQDRIINDIINNLFRLIFIIYCHPYYSQHTRELNTIEERYSNLINQHLVHFIKSDTIDFYRWAKKYMDGYKKYNSTIYTPITDDEYKTTVNIIFDRLFNENEDIYFALKEKMSNAWYQKIYRQKNKGKKENYYALTKKTRDALDAIKYKRNMSEEKVIESLINECFIKECSDYNGVSLF